MLGYIYFFNTIVEKTFHNVKEFKKKTQVYIYKFYARL
jgi:hypothetical protein